MSDVREINRGLSHIFLIIFCDLPMKPKKFPLITNDYVHTSVVCLFFSGLFWSVKDERVLTSSRAQTHLLSRSLKDLFKFNLFFNVNRKGSSKFSSESNLHFLFN